jgi:hypothetical protein
LATSPRSSTRVSLPPNGTWRSACPHASPPAQSELPETCFRFLAFVPWETLAIRGALCLINRVSRQAGDHRALGCATGCTSGRTALTSVVSRIMQIGKPKEAQGRKVVTIPKVSRGRRCPRCPFYDPSGKCRDKTIRSGRCGDWIWYVRNGQQFRRLWSRPRDPRTPLQRQWRARLGAASRRYSEGLPDGQQEACIAAGARLQSRPRLFQSGPLTGQQYWVRQECAREAAVGVRSAGPVTKPLQTQGILASTWERYRCAAVVLPWQCRSTTAHSGRMVRIGRVREGCRTGQSCRNGRWRALWRGG